jgi:hypothetical protein
VDRILLHFVFKGKLFSKKARKFRVRNNLGSTRRRSEETAVWARPRFADVGLLVFLVNCVPQLNQKLGNFHGIGHVGIGLPELCNNTVAVSIELAVQGEDGQLAHGCSFDGLARGKQVF